MPTSQPVRRYPRIHTERPAQLRLLDRGQEEYGTTKEIGLGGCSVVSDRAFARECVVEIAIPLESGVVTAVGRVVYVLNLASKGGDGFEVGLEFLQIAPRHRQQIQDLFDSE